MEKEIIGTFMIVVPLMTLMVTPLVGLLTNYDPEDWQPWAIGGLVNLWFVLAVYLLIS